MSVINEKLLENLKVVKRNGKKVDFDTAKVAIAIKKGFDGANKAEDEEERYTTKDIQKVYQSVIKRILKEYKEEEKIKIENIIKYFLFFYFYFSSGFSISGVNVSILTTFPPSLVLIKVTPCVDLPRTLISFT